MWKKIKKILQKQGGKCIIIEENQPVYIIMKLEDYENSLDDKQSLETEKINQNIDQWRAEGEEKNQAESIEDSEAGELKVEDLPF